MRVLSVALAVSAALHGGAIAWGLSHEPQDTEERPTVTLAPIEIVPTTPPEPEPLVVALLPDHTVVLPARVPTGSRATRPRLAAGSPRQIAATEPAATTVFAPAAEPGSATDTPHPLMSMRRPAGERVLPAVPSSGFRERFLRESRPLPPPEIKSGQLQPDGTGTKAERETFRIRVAADGSATIEDKANLQRKGLLGGSFDVTDAMMRRQGIDPYASAKLKLLDETREERVAIGKRYRTQQLARSRELVQKQLVVLWSRTMDPAARKQALFELWDDCAEAGTDELVVAGRAARAHVVGFIRSKLPAGGVDAFTRDELARFNGRRKSRAEFAPYESPR